MWFTDTLYPVFLTTGLTVGFGHCIGMCGPIVVSLSLSSRSTGVLVRHLLYSGGRITTYAFLGGLTGLTGSFTGLTASIAGLQKGVMVLAGLLIVLMGLAMTGLLPLGRIYRDHYNPYGWISRNYRKLSSAKSPLAYYPLGLLLGLLPCGPVYTALIAAARAGMEARSSIEGFLSGAGLMVVFGAGTVPALLLVARLAGLGWLKSRTLLYRISAVLMILLGVYFVIRALRY